MLGRRVWYETGRTRPRSTRSFVGGLLDGIDRWQRRHAVVGFPIAVVKKFSEDGASQLAALLSYYAFIALFPLILVLVTILEIVLNGDPDLQARVLDSALADFPVLGEQLRMQVGSAQGKGISLALGLIVAFIGARGVAATFQRVCNKLWSIPYVDRPPFHRAALRTATILLLLGIGAVSGAGIVTVVSALDLGPATQMASLLLSLTVTALLFLGVFRIATASQVRTSDMVRGAILSAVVWQILLTLGTVLVSHQLAHATNLYGTFGIVLGLLAWLVVQASVTLYAIELDVVRAEKLWPRGLRQPLTAADERALASYARRQQRDENQAIDIRFEPGVGED
jgi:YihY family inner membrane protein